LGYPVLAGSGGDCPGLPAVAKGEDWVSGYPGRPLSGGLVGVIRLDQPIWPGK